MAEDDVISDLQRSYADLTLAQKRIAEAIVEDPDFVAFATVDKLASKLGVASSTIVRFTYRLGLDGYPDLQERIRKMVKARMRSTQVSEVTGASAVAHLADGTASQSLSHDLENLNRTVLELESGTIDVIVRRMVTAQRIYFTGGLASDWLAEYAALSVDRLRGNTTVIDRRHAAATLVDMTRKDVLVVFSFPPYSSQTMQIVEAARKQLTTVIGITDSPISPVGQQADLTLTAHVSGIGPQNSLIGPMALLNAILNGIASGSENTAERYRKIFALMDDWNTFILRSGPDVAG
jgi:DNA-binding MurR/RpiR family transcriptional regulator